MSIKSNSHSTDRCGKADHNIGLLVALAWEISIGAQCSGADHGKSILHIGEGLMNSPKESDSAPSFL